MDENENNIQANEEQNIQNNIGETPINNEGIPSVNTGANLQPKATINPAGSNINEPVTPVINQSPVPKKKKNNKLIVFLIILIVLILGAGVFFAVKYIFPKDTNEPTTEKAKILYTFTDPIGNKINIIEKDILDEKYKGVDLTRFEDKEEELREKVREYVIKDSEVEALELPETYNDAFSVLLRSIRGRNGGGFSLKGAIKKLQKEETPEDIIEYVTENSKVDWNDQALILVYKNLGSGESKEGLERKLTREGFTEEEIEYAMTETEDVDYYEQAVEEACFYRFYKKYEKEKAARYLRMVSFTEEEIEYAVNIAYEKIK